MALISTISTYVYNEVTPGSGSYAANLTFTSDADVFGGTGTALGVGVNIAGAEVVNFGELQSRGNVYTVLLDSYTRFYNFGIIKSRGLDAAAGGYVYNYTQISGLAASGVGSNAVVMTSGTVVNAGNINANNDGVLLTSGRVLNTSVINAGVDGVKLAGNAQLQNRFEIYGGVSGVELANGGEVVNDALINGETYGVVLDHGGLIKNSGSIVGGTDAILNKAGALTLDLYTTEKSFSGAVVDSAGNGVLNLAAGGTGDFNLGGAVSGFSAINFAAGSSWTLEGTKSELAAGEVISGFTAGETIRLDGFSASGETYVSGVGLELVSASSTVVLDITGTLVSQNFAIADTLGGTSITFVAASVLPAGNNTVSSGGTQTSPIIGPGSSDSAQSGSTLTNPTIAGGTLEIAASVSVVGEISFTGSNGKLILDGTLGGSAGFPTTISGFMPGDSIVFTNSTYDPSDTVSVVAPGIVDIDADGTNYYLHIDNAYVGEKGFSIVSDPNFVTLIESLCFLHGTRILTPTGAVAVEDLAIGDAVVTRFGGMQRIKWLGRQSFAPAFLEHNPEKWPVCIRAGALANGVPARDLYVSPGHSMLLGDTLVLARDLVNGVTVVRVLPESDVHYVQIELEGHDCVIAEGAWAETFADGPGLRAQFHNAAEFYALYPDAPPPEALRLCAPRPERGPRLAAALLPVVECATAGAPPGRLEGWLETVSDWRIEGWARDLAHPDLPVRLEILSGDQVIGTVLAREFRKDLARAGKGRCAFRFVPPMRLTAEVLAGLVIRRAADGAELPGTERFRRVA